MKLHRGILAAAFAAFTVIACQSAPESNEPVADVDNADNSVEATESAGGEQAAPAADQRERPEPEAPRAEGAELAAYIASADVLFLDVRRPDEIEELGTVEGYLNIPVEELAERLDEIPRNKPVLTA